MTKTAAHSSGRQATAGIGQLSLVEHALCPLDCKAALTFGLVHEAGYHFLDKHRHMKTARAQVICPLGLAPGDEFYLWGLLALTFAGRNPDHELHATPHYCLRQLGLIDQQARRGGRQYQQFAAAIERLSLVSYRNDRFYDPVRAEHRNVSFGFLSYSLPLDPASSRAWRFVWNPLLFEFVKAAGGCLYFDLNIYRQLDPASRRLFLFVSKIFARRQTTPRLDLQHLAVNVLGFSSTLIARDLKAKVTRCVRTLERLGILPPTKDLYIKRAPGQYSLMLTRGPYYEICSAKPGRHALADSPLYEPLVKIGLDEAAIARLLRKFPQQVVREWTDITLAAQERFGASFFTRSPQAYLVDNVQKAAQGTRTPPDWWHELRQAERQTRRKAGSDELSTAARRVFADVQSALFEPASEVPNIRPSGRPLANRSATPSVNPPIRIGQLLRSASDPGQ